MLYTICTDATLNLLLEGWLNLQQIALCVIVKSGGAFGGKILDPPSVALPAAFAAQQYVIPSHRTAHPTVVK